jgi:NTP pyrophosphatase (non-canonical NTP hydrolase)
VTYLNDLKFSEILSMQRQLQDKHKDKWTALTPHTGRDSMLWLVEELGEAIAIIKKKGDDQIMNNPATREHYIEELCDVLMFFTDTLLCYDISADELATAYSRKHQTNMGRDFEADHAGFIVK